MVRYKDYSDEAVEAALARLDTRIKQAFADVTLGDGIGYFEANAIDDYLRPGDPAYEAARTRDRERSWLELAAQEGYNSATATYLDARGLHFLLPACLVTGSSASESLEFLFECEKPLKPETAAMLTLLTPAQWEALLDYYAYHVDREGWLDYWCTSDPGWPGTPCTHCGLVHAYTRRDARIALSRAEAERKVDAEPLCRAWRRLQATYLRHHPHPARAYLSSPRGESRQHLFEGQTA